MTPQEKLRREEAAAERFDRHMLEATGHTLLDYERARDAGPMALAHVQLYGRLVDESGAAEMLEAWAAAERKSNAGRKPHLSFRAVLVLHLMHVADGNVRYQNIARTLFARMTPATREYLGITITDGSRDDWYQRYWRSLNRALALLSPWQVPRNTFLSAAAYKRALDSYSQERRDRMDEVMNRLAHASARRLPAEIRATYKGNLAIDATPIKLAGRPNPNVDNLHSTRMNLDAMSGRYSRHDDHKGYGADDDDAAWELETVVTVANGPGDPDSFPVLTTGLTMHHPGKSNHGALIAVQFHTRLFDERGFIMADRLYNWMKPHSFQLPTRKMGYRHVYQMRVDQLAGLGGGVDDIICVEGGLYIKWMPKPLINARLDFVEGKISREVYEARMANRSKYRCKLKGKPDADGSQRFFYPDVSKVLLFDPATETQLKRKPKLPATGALHPNSPEALKMFKILQTFEYKSQEWRDWFGLRSHVEANNQFMKDDAHTDLGNKNKRRPRGYAYQALVSAAVAAVSNIRRVVNFLVNARDNALDDLRPKQRARRRTDEFGQRLEHHKMEYDED